LLSGKIECPEKSSKKGSIRVSVAVNPFLSFNKLALFLILEFDCRPVITS